MPSRSRRPRLERAATWLLVRPNASRSAVADLDAERNGTGITGSVAETLDLSGLQLRPFGHRRLPSEEWLQLECIPAGPSHRQKTTTQRSLHGSPCTSFSPMSTPTIFLYPSCSRLVASNTSGARQRLGTSQCGSCSPGHMLFVPEALLRYDEYGLLGEWRRRFARSLTRSLPTDISV